MALPIVVFLVFTLACGLIWHNRAPRGNEPESPPDARHEKSETAAAPGAENSHHDRLSPRP